MHQWYEGLDFVTWHFFVPVSEGFNSPGILCEVNAFDAKLSLTRCILLWTCLVFFVSFWLLSMIIALSESKRSGTLNRVSGWFPCNRHSGTILQRAALLDWTQAEC